jgi:hypothetical protein
MINALLMFATAGIGFGGWPWAAFTIGASAIVLLGAPAQLEILNRHAGQPVTDIVLAMMFKVALVVAGAFASAWAGYGLRNLLSP